MSENEKDQKPEEDVYCDNHPDRKGETFTGGGAYKIHLCDDCQPDWPL